MADFKVFNTNISFDTKGEIEFIDLTDQIQAAVAKSRIRNGVVHVFAPHATGVLILTENEYGLLEDIRAFLEKMVPRNKEYSHPSNAHAHLNLFCCLLTEHCHWLMATWSSERGSRSCS